MKVGRNELCPCGSGKKYKRCCMDSASKQHAEIFDDFAQAVAMTPDLTLDELNLVAQHKMNERNNRANEDFCGLTPTQMANWLYAPFSELEGVHITVPNDLSASPVMRYLSLIIDEIGQQGGSIKATAKGNLPVKLVKQASELLPEFAVSEFETVPGVSEYRGSNEDQFNALHYTRILAEISGIIYLKGGHYYVEKKAQTQGLADFFLPMLETAVRRYKWSYLDGWSEEVDLQPFWLFMLWRLQTHCSVDKLNSEVSTAFPDLLKQIPHDEYFSQQDQLNSMIDSRFVVRFLQFWGFLTIDPRRYVGGVRVLREATVLPLLRQSFAFSV
ncbi:YecA family protein [Ketobacter sp.]